MTGTIRPVFERHGDADIDLVVIRGCGSLNRGVDDGERAQGFDGGAGDEGQEGQAEAVALLEFRLSLRRGGAPPSSYRRGGRW